MADSALNAAVAGSADGSEHTQRTHQPIISLSSYVSGGLDAALAEAAGSPKVIRRSGQALTERLKQLSRSKARGGTVDLERADGSAMLRTPDRKVRGVGK